MNFLISSCSFFIYFVCLNNIKLIYHRANILIIMKTQSRFNSEESDRLNSYSVPSIKRKRGRPRKNVSPLPAETSKPPEQRQKKLMIPQITLCDPLVRKRVVSPFPSGYHRIETLPFPFKHFIELTQIDFEFIRDTRQKFRFYDFFLLNPERLIKIYIFFSKIAENVGDKAQLTLKLQQRLLNIDEQPAYAIFQLMKEEQPVIFEQFTEVLTQRWIFRSKIGDLFLLNEPEKIQDAVPYSARQKFKISSIYSNPWKMRNFLHRTLKKTLIVHSNYLQIKEDHENRKKELISFMMQFFRNVSILNSDISFESLPEDLLSMSLLEVDQKLRELLSGLKTWKPQEETSRSKNKGQHTSRIMSNLSKPLFSD